MNLVVLDAEMAGAVEAALPSEAIEQSWNWGVLQTRVEGRPEFRVFGVKSADGEWLARLLAIRQNMGGGLIWKCLGRPCWLWAPRGPVFKSDLREDERAAAWDLLKQACENWGRLRGAVFLRVEPGDLPEGFELGGKRSAEEYLPSHSLVLDLSVSEDSILAQMTQKGRYNIKVAQKAGVTVRRGGEADLADFYGVLKQTGARDGFGVHALDFYRDFLTILGEKAVFWVAELESRIIGGVLVTLHGHTATYYFGASSNQDRNVMAPYLLQWTAMTAAKTTGFTTYDFLGVAPEAGHTDGTPEASALKVAPEAAEGGEGAAARHALAGVTQFKTRFGGTRVNYAGPRVFVYRPVLWTLRQIARRFRKSLR